MRTPTEALKEIRDRLTYFCLRTDGRYDPPWATELVGIIDEAVTDGHAVGNAAAMRAALVKIAHYCDDENGMDDPYCVDGHILSDIARAALAAPPRECDVGSAEEQIERLYGGETCPSCKSPQMTSDGCACVREGPCALRWAQTPYEAQEGGAE